MPAENAVSGAKTEVPVLTDKAVAESFMSDLRKGLKKKYGRKREGVHMSDLCPRQIVFRDLNPGLELTNTDLNNFTSGAAIGAALASTAEESKDTYTTEQFTSIGHFINGHIDVYNKKTNTPIEFKTYRSGSAEKIPKWHQLDQLKSYMAGQDSDTGILLYQLLMKFDDGEFDSEEVKTSIKDGMLMVEFGPFVAFIVHMSEAERERHKLAKIETGLAAARARAYGMPALAPHVMNNPGLKWLCRKCPFLKQCKILIEEAELK